MKHIVAILLLCLTANAAPIGFMQPRIGGTSLVGWWTMNATNNGRAMDFSGNANDFVLTNSPSIDNGVIGNSIKFDGTNQRGQSSLSGNLFQKTSTFSVATWIKQNSGGSEQSIVGNLTSGSFRGWELHKSENSATGGRANLINVFMIDVYPTSYLETSMATVLQTNVWQHLAFTYDGSGSTNGINFYLNGTIQPKGISVQNLGAGSTTGGNIGIAGRSNDTLFAPANLDDVRIYTRVLTAEEVLQLYNGGRGTQQ